MYQVFKRRWWRDAKCTVPGVGRSKHVAWVYDEDEARLYCRGLNYDDEGKRIDRPYGVAYEYRQA